MITASDLKKVLINQSVCVVGQGETAGGPAIEWLSTLGAVYSIIDTKTKDPCQELKKADLIICASGRSGVITPACLKKNVILIGVGTHKENGKLTGDYNVEEIKDIAKCWTPTPGGVGPLNLAYLSQNLLTAAEKQANTETVLYGMRRIRDAGYTPMYYSGKPFTLKHINYDHYYIVASNGITNNNDSLNSDYSLIIVTSK